MRLVARVGQVGYRPLTVSVAASVLPQTYVPPLYVKRSTAVNVTVNSSRPIAFVRLNPGVSSLAVKSIELLPSVGSLMSRRISG